MKNFLTFNVPLNFLYFLSTCNGTLDVEWRTNFNRHVPAEELRSRCKCLASPAVRYLNKNNKNKIKKIKVDLNYRADRYHWNNLSGYVKFKDGEKSAFIELKIPCESDLCFEEENVGLELVRTRGTLSKI